MDEHNPDTSSPNTPENQSTPPDLTTEPASPAPLPPSHRPPPWEQLRRFFACNPFYLVSAALLLYSLYLVSADRHFLPTEVGQLSFNLSSVQLYETLVVVTAIFLARRAIWYDSTLLVGLENLLLLVPFILISQAALIEARLVWTLCIAAAFLAGGRLSLLKRYTYHLNFPRPLAWVGASVLLFNAALPIVYRLLHESKVGTNPDWGAAYETNQYLWWLLVPALCGLTSLVPWSRPRTDEPTSQWRWLPLGLLSLWLVGTGVHLYCLGYVYDFRLRPELLAPGVWTLVWVLCLQMDRVISGLKESRKNALWILPLIATLLATPQPQKVVFLALTFLNISIFASIYWRRKAPLALHLTLISMMTVIGGLPEEWGRAMTPEFYRQTYISGAALIYFLICISLSRDPKVATFGALVAAVLIGMWAQQPYAIHWITQAGLAFLLLHSLRWVDSEHRGAALFRWLVALAWVGHSIAWTHFYSAGSKACLVAAPVLIAWFVFRWLRGAWGPLSILLGAMLVLLSTPGHAAAIHLQSTPAGLLALIGSFLLFGLGTLGAITKHRWSNTAARIRNREI